jgi:flagellar biosynthesis/type III secretory pathway protein FliH
MSRLDDESQAGYDRGYNEGYAEGLRAGPSDDQYDAGHADGFAEGRRESDVTGHLLRPHARHLLDMLSDAAGGVECAEIRSVLEDLLP